MTVAEKIIDIEALNELEPQDMLRWAYTEFGDRAAIITSFQNTGCVIIDMAQQVAPELRVLTVDTLRLHPETYAFIETVEKHYGIAIERFQPDPERLKRMIQQHGEFLFFDSKPKQEHCCDIRKVEPNRRALATVDVWITGVRRDQSEGRKQTEKAAYVFPEGRRIVKLSPLADWSEEQVRAYLSEHNAPYNPLYDQGYTSIGCMICTTPTLPHEDIRAGRWRWFNYLDGDRKECGIHTSGGGI